MKVAFIGLGTMGAAMALSLVLMPLYVGLFGS